MRNDFNIISNYIKPQSHVLDLGCGSGELLAHLRDNKQVSGYGLEISATNINACIDKGVNVIEQDLDNGLQNFKSQSFDTVIMTQALQAVRFPDILLDEMLRIGKESIITFPNFGHWRCRYHLLTKGVMPVSEALPYHWYNTPNIHLCTFKDFEKLCYQKNIFIIERAVLNHEYQLTKINQLWPNLLGEIAIYRITK